MKTNHHTHSHFSDGSTHPEAYIEQAIQLNFDVLGFTEHSPLPFDNPFSFKPFRKEEYLKLMQDLRSRYADKLIVHVGMEMDFIPGISEDFLSIRKEYRADYLIGSVHLVRPNHSDELWFTDGPCQDTYDEGVSKLFMGDIRRAVSTYYRQVNTMIATQDFEIIGHFDKIKMHNRNRYFLEDEKWYMQLVRETLSLIRQKGLIVEVNSRGIYKKRSDSTYPGLEILKEIGREKIPVMINSDAHQPGELDGAYPETMGILSNAGISEVVYYRKNQWEYSSLKEWGK